MYMENYDVMSYKTKLWFLCINISAAHIETETSKLPLYRFVRVSIKQSVYFLWKGSWKQTLG